MLGHMRGLSLVYRELVKLRISTSEGKTRAGQENMDREIDLKVFLNAQACSQMNSDSTVRQYHFGD